MRDLLRRYAISGAIPAPLMRLRSAALGGAIPPRLVLPALAWTTYRVAKPELRQMRRLVDPERASIDVGANVGVHSYFLARWSRAVFAYEPNPELQPFLARALGSRVSLSSLALSDQRGTATLSVPVLAGRAADPYGSLGSADGDGEVRRYTVATAPLDELDHRGVGFIKIDVEGHEAAVLRGAEETLRRERPVLLVELEQRHSDADIRDIFASLETAGFRGRFLLDRRLRPLEEFSLEQHQQLPLESGNARGYVENFFFVPSGGAADFERAAAA